MHLKTLNNSDTVKTFPDYGRAFREAHAMLVFSKATWLPVNPFDIAKNNHWTVRSIRDTAKETGMTRAEILELMTNPDASAMHVNGSRQTKFTIIYNERVTSPGRIRWSIAHEIGHIALNHVSDSKPKDVQEKEAERFAAELLCPKPILLMIGPEVINSPNRLKTICELSQQASTLQYSAFKRYYFEYDEMDIGWLDRDPLIDAFQEYLKCIPACINSTKLSFFEIPKRSERVIDKIEKRFAIKTNSNGRFEVCPRCGNHSMSDLAYYCKMCGLPLYNNCTNLPPPPTSMSPYCGTSGLDGNARYCELCGFQTGLVRQGLLYSWEEMLTRFGTVNVNFPPYPP